MPFEPVREKWESFNWAVLEIDGHSMEAMLDALDEAGTIADRPTVIIAHTEKGKGVSFMEGEAVWHYKVPDEQEYALALKELEKYAG